MADAPVLSALCAQAHELLQAGNYAEAVTAFETALQADAFDAEAHDGLATAHFMLGAYDAAIKHFQLITRIEPRRGDPYVNMGAVYNRMGEYQKAIEMLRKGIKMEKNSSEGFYNLGIAHRHLKQHALAIPAYREAIRINPKMAEAYQNLGNVYSEMGNYPQAIAQYKKALELRPDFGRAQRGLEKAQSAQAAAKEALSPFGRLVDVQPESQVNSAADVGSRRELSDLEREADRQELHEMAEELQIGLQDLLSVLKSELEPSLRLLSKVLSQKDPHSGAENPEQVFKYFQAARYKFSPTARRLSKSVQKLRDHEAGLR